MSAGSTATLVEQRVRRACWLALGALGLMIWSMLDPRPVPVVMAMSVAQALGTLSLLMFAVAVIGDLHHRFVRARGAPGADGPRDER